MSEQIKGIANDGFEYTPESAEVLKYKEAHADATDEAAVASVVDIHNSLLEGKEVATTGEADDVIVGLVRSNIKTEAKAEESTEVTAEATAEDESTETAGEAGGEATE